KQLGDLRQLLVYASSLEADKAELRRWACAILRVMHVFLHAENDLFSVYSEEIQRQVLSPYEKAVFHDGNAGKVFLKVDDCKEEPIEIQTFELKPFKRSNSTVLKLLAKSDELAMRIFDKVG